MLDLALQQRIDHLLTRIEGLLPDSPAAPDWQSVLAARWESLGLGGGLQRGRLTPIQRLDEIQLGDLLHLDRPRDALVTNTRQFLAGLPANHALLWGGKGTGKSSLVKALLNALAPRGLRLIELDKGELAQLPHVVAPLAELPWRFVLFCDDLSFEAGEPGYKELKSLLDGSVGVAPDNVLLYATSNRRHLLPEFQQDNQATRLVDTELHHGEAVEERISLSERFGLWLSFHPFNQDQYLAIVEHWCGRLGRVADAQARAEAITWALARGSRSGRVAQQFARHWVGRGGLEKMDGA